MRQRIDLYASMIKGTNKLVKEKHLKPRAPVTHGGGSIMLWGSDGRLHKVD